MTNSAPQLSQQQYIPVTQQCPEISRYNDHITYLNNDSLFDFEDPSSDLVSERPYEFNLGQIYDLTQKCQGY